MRVGAAIFAAGALCLCAVSAAASPRVIHLGEEVSGSEPRFEVLSSSDEALTVRLEIPSLEVEEFDVEGRKFHLLTVPRGSLQGEVGKPALPLVGRFVSIPARSGVEVRVVTTVEERLAGYDLLPMQADPEEVEGFVIDEAYYSAARLHAAPLVGVGEPAILRDLRVVPLTFSPVRYLPAEHTVEVSRSITVEIRFAGEDLRNVRERTREIIPTSFDRLYQALVLNYEGPAQGQRVANGTYLMICPDDTAAVSELQPLFEWRKRSGHPSVLATTTDIGGSTATAIKAYVQDAYDDWENPPEYVVLVGDAMNSDVLIPTFYDSTYGGEGDHPYTQLEGGDVLSDIHVGRLSVESTTRLAYVVDKIVSYELDPYTAQTHWFKAACLIGDPSISGTTCVQQMQWIKQRLLQLGYTNIDEIYSGDFLGQFTSSLNNGVGIMAYRGWWHMSDIYNADIEALENGRMLPFTVALTCDTGSFAAGTSRSETFLRAGSAGNTKGAIGSIGTATIYTHTRHNNQMMFGIMQGLLYEDLAELGADLTRGKLEFYLHFNDHESYNVRMYSYWNNLMGDPATPCWTAVPGNVEVFYPSTVPVGATSVIVTVNDQDAGTPLPGACVCLWKGDETYVSGFTDENGEVELAVSLPTTGPMRITVTKRNCAPFAGEITVADMSDNVALNGYQVDDDTSGSSSGNHDGSANPGESLEIPVQVWNRGTSRVHNVQAVMRSEDPFVTITDSTEAFGDILAGGALWSGDDFDVSIDGGCPDGRAIPLGVDISCDEGSWHALLELPVLSVSCEYAGHTWYDVGAELDPGEWGDVSIAVRNTGGADGQSVVGTLSSLSQHLSVTDGTGSYGTVAKGATVENTADRFGVSASAMAYPGYVVTCLLALETSSGARDTVVVGLKIGSASNTDPVGPDAYGYCAFDDTDTGYPETPVYDWIEIAGDYGGAGEDVGLDDNGVEQDDHAVVDLPFAFAYYGSTFTQVTICSNGWIAMGACEIEECWNTTIPAAGGPNAMIAPFWDDLYQLGAAEVWKYYDSANHRFIVEWSRLKNEGADATEVFEVILYDPAHHPTPTGDGEILFQYETVTNNDPTYAYATVGIENLDHSDGVLYTFWNYYADGAAPLASGRAIRFMPVVEQVMGCIGGEVTNLTAGGAPVDGVQVRLLEAGRSFFTTEEGIYFGRASVDTYTVIACHPSFTSDTAYAVAVVEDETTYVDFEIEDVAGPEIANTTCYPVTADTVGPYEITTHIQDYSGIDQMVFYYRTNFGPFQSLPLIPQGNDEYLAQIPGQPVSTRVDYYVYARDVVDYESMDPERAPGDTTHVFHVAPVFSFQDDMETVGDWTVGEPDDDAMTGIWERVDPNATYEGDILVQPEDDHTADPGSQCYITGQSSPGAGQGENDVDGGKTTLLSPVFDITGFQTIGLSYYRWYTNDTGYSPSEDYWRVEVTDDGSNWQSLENTNVSDRSWVYQEFDLDAYIDPTTQVQVRFVAEDVGGGSIVEAGVDDFWLCAYSVPPDVQPPLVTVYDPNGGEQLVGGGAVPYEIRWHSEDDIGLSSTKILLSTDGGLTYADTIANGPLDSTFTWSVPEMDETACRIKVVCLDGASNQGMDVSDGDFEIVSVTAVGRERIPLPDEVVLLQNRPNPFNPVTEIRFGLPSPMQVSLRVYSVEGRLVRTLAEGRFAAGHHAVLWTGRDAHGVEVSSGIYFCRLETTERVLSRKMLLLK